MGRIKIVVSVIESIPPSPLPSFPADPVGYQFHFSETSTSSSTSKYQKATIRPLTQGLQQLRDRDMTVSRISAFGSTGNAPDRLAARHIRADEGGARWRGSRCIRTLRASSGGA